MRFFRSLLLLAVLLLWAAPASGAEQLVMECPVCDHVDVDGSGLEPNATLTLVITDVATGQDVLPATRVTTDGSGRFSREYDMDLAKHPGLLASLYEPNGADLILAAHANAQAPGVGGEAWVERARHRGADDGRGGLAAHAMRQVERHQHDRHRPDQGQHEQRHQHQHGPSTLRVLDVVVGRRPPASSASTLM